MSSSINFADVSFVFLGTVLVMLMTPGLALFYGGMVRSKNVLSTTMHSYSVMFIVSLQWILIGYSLAFGTSVVGFIGDLRYMFLNGVGMDPNPVYAATIPQNLFMMFQMMFAIITPALISGAFAERIKFSSFLVFIVLWIFLVYDPVANWVWGDGGWLKKLGALDFAGGNVVHITSGVSGLVIALFLGKRKNVGRIAPHQIPMTVLGAGILWFGWFGFNACSALTLTDGVGMIAFITTNTAAAAAAIAWITCEWFKTGKPTMLGAASGLVAGLVSITPGAGFVSPMSALLIGLAGGAICYFGVTSLKRKFGYDDALDAFGCHGIGGTWGGIATGLFADKSINALVGSNGFFFGGDLLGKQFIAIGATYAYVIIVTTIILIIVKKMMGLRSKEEDEDVGLDLSYHGEKAYREEAVI